MKTAFTLLMILLVACGHVHADGGAMIWKQDRVFPAFARPAEMLDAIDISRESRDVQTMLTGLQGIVNRKQPRLLLLNRNNEREQWPETLGLVYTLKSDPWRVIEKYKGEIKGLVVYDERMPDTLNLATTLAGLEDALIVSPAQAERLQKSPFRFEVIQDYNGMFTDRHAAYEYAMNTLLPRCTKRMVIGLNPKAHHAHLRDFAVAAQALVVWLDPDPPGNRGEAGAKGDEALIDLILKKYTAVHTFYIGWWPDEGRGIAKASTYGIATIPADFFENMTVYAGMSRELSVPVVAPKPELQNKFYLALVFSDGDNMQYCEHALKSSDNLWASDLRGSFPMNWTISPPLLDAAPQMLNYYYKTATANDCIVSGPSGFGYTDPQYWDPALFRDYVRLTELYFRTSGFNIITVWNKIPDAMAAIYEQEGPSLIGITAQEPIGRQQRIELINGRLPRILLAPRYDGDAPRHEKIMREHILRWRQSFDGNPTRPEFWASQPVAWEMGMRDTKAMVDHLKAEFGDRLEIVRMDHLMMLCCEYHGLPYNVALRAKATASSCATGPDDAAKLTDGSFSRGNGWQSGTGEADQWVEIDLGRQYAISRYVVKNAQSAGYPASFNTRAFKIRASRDGTTWRDIDEVLHNKDGIVERRVEPFEARLVRLVIDEAGSDGIARLQEIELYGHE